MESHIAQLRTLDQSTGARPPVLAGPARAHVQQTHELQRVSDGPTTVDVSPSPNGSPVDPRSPGSFLLEPLGNMPASLRGARSRWLRLYQGWAVALDLAAAVIAMALAILVRFGDAVQPHYVLFGFVAPPVWVATIALARGYERRFLGVGTEEYRSIMRADVVLLAAIGFGSYATKTTIARGFVLIFVPTALAMAMLFRYALRQYVHRLRSRGRCMLRTVVVGRPDSATELVGRIEAEPAHGLMVVAVCASGFDGQGAIDYIGGVPWLGSSQDTLAAVDLVDADVVAVSSHSDLVGGELRRLSWGLEERNVDLIVSPGIMEVAGPRLSIRPAAGLALLHVERPVASSGRKVAKFLFDRAVSLLLCLFALPVLLAVAIAIKVDDPGPVLFKQRRVGATGKPFEMFKFRSMVADAEARLGDAICEQGGHDGNAVMFKQREDPRITRVGKRLRRYSLDELPQLLNVVKGEMSLVGPRPPLMAEVEAYEPDAIRRLHVRPGMTGLWQVSGRSDLSWEDTLRLDLRYVDNWSMTLDLQILWRTVRAVLAGSGAY